MIRSVTLSMVPSFSISTLEYHLEATSGKLTHVVDVADTSEKTGTDSEGGKDNAENDGEATALC